MTVFFSYHIFTFLFSVFCFLTHSPSLALLAYPQKKPTYFCVSPSLPHPPKQNYLLGRRVVLCVCFARFGLTLLVLISFRLRTIWNWKGAKKSWDTFKEKEEI